MLVEELKQRQLSLVLSNAGADWKREATQVVRECFPIGSEFTGEDIRLRCERKNVVPHHPNAWGGFIRSLRKKDLIEETGRWVAMKGPKSNGRRTPQYRRKA